MISITAALERDFILQQSPGALSAGDAIGRRKQLNIGIDPPVEGDFRARPDALCVRLLGPRENAGAGDRWVDAGQGTAETG